MLFNSDREALTVLGIIIIGMLVGVITGDLVLGLGLSIVLLAFWVILLQIQINKLK